MKTLDQILIKCESDKATVFTRTWAKPHGYAPHLERFFEPLRDKTIKLLEIGVGGGESIRAWLEYFTVPRIFGVDLVSGTNPYNTPGVPTHERYIFSCGNQSDPKFWSKFIKTYGDFDVIIDDGSHNSDDIMATISCLWPHVKSGGIYEVEDLASAPEAAKHIQAWANGIIAGTSTADSIYFSNQLAILRKK